MHIQSILIKPSQFELQFAVAICCLVFAGAVVAAILLAVVAASVCPLRLAAGLGSAAVGS
ncbi:hypothetical protein U1Q18_044343, partial [Sarracenia purpurea var. burkii]